MLSKFDINSYLPFKTRFPLLRFYQLANVTLPSNAKADDNWTLPSLRKNIICSSISNKSTRTNHSSSKDSRTRSMTVAEKKNELSPKVNRISSNFDKDRDRAGRV